MARPSKIDRLPQEVREKIGELRTAGHTIDEIMAHLKKLDLPDGSLPARSGLGSHILELDKMLQEALEARAFAEAMKKRVGEEPESRLGALNAEFLQIAIFKLNRAVATGQAENFDAKEILAMARAHESLERAIKTNAETTLKLRREAKAESAEAATAVAKRAGLSKAMIDDIVGSIIGKAAA